MKKKKKRKLRVRVGVIVVQEGKVLLARQHVAQGQDFWIVPGGKMKKREGLLDCARREMAEETGLEVEGLRPLYVGDFFKGRNHIVDTFWLGKVVGGELKRREDEIDNLRFFDVEQLSHLDLRPAAMAERLVGDVREGFRSETAYLGKYFRDPQPMRDAENAPHEDDEEDDD